MEQFLSLFQTATGSWHVPSILMAASWLLGTVVAGGFMLGNLRVNRDDRIKAFEKEQRARAENEAKDNRIAQLELSNTSLQQSVTTIRDYSEVAKLNAYGKPFADGDLVFHSELATMMAKTYRIKGEVISFNRGEDTEQLLREIIAKYPHFPFAHYALALCLRDRQQPEWNNIMIHAQKILHHTTSIVGHHPDHDDVARRIEKLLSSDP